MCRVSCVMCRGLQLMQPGDTSASFPTLSLASCGHYYLPLLQALTRLWEVEQRSQEQERERAQEEEEEEQEEEVGVTGAETGISALVGIVECFSSLIMLTKYEGNPHTKAGTYHIMQQIFHTELLRWLIIIFTCKLSWSGVGLNKRGMLLMALREVNNSETVRLKCGCITSSFTCLREMFSFGIQFYDLLSHASDGLSGCIVVLWYIASLFETSHLTHAGMRAYLCRYMSRRAACSWSPSCAPVAARACTACSDDIRPPWCACWVSF